MGANIIITKPNGDRVPMESRRTATSITAAKQTWALNAEDTVAMTVVSPFPQSYGLGDAITVFGRDYRWNRLPRGKDLEIAHDYAENGDYFPVITGCIDEIESFTTNAIIVWERI